MLPPVPTNHSLRSPLGGAAGCNQLTPTAGAGTPSSHSTPSWGSRGTSQDAVATLLWPSQMALEDRGSDVLGLSGHRWALAGTGRPVEGGTSSWHCLQPDHSHFAPTVVCFLQEKSAEPHGCMLTLQEVEQTGPCQIWAFRERMTQSWASCVPVPYTRVDTCTHAHTHSPGLTAVSGHLNPDPVS